MLEDQGEPERWQSLLQPAMQELRARHPDVDVQLNYTTYPYDKTRGELLTAMSNQTPIDLISVDQFGEDLLSGMRCIGMVVRIMIKSMQSGHGLT
jgi:hypothetical protein